jgi:hypothetical protein
MPSEKSRYLKARQGPPAPVVWQELVPALERLGVTRLAETLAHAAERYEPLCKVVQLQAAFVTVPDDVEKLKQAITYATHIASPVRYDGSDAYAQILDELKQLLEKAAREGRRKGAADLAQHARTHLEAMGEQLQDAHAWEMSCDELEELAERLLDGPVDHGETISPKN